MSEEARLLQVILFGDSSAKKSNIIHKLIHPESENSIIPQIGSDMGIWRTEVRNINCKLRIWDTPNLDSRDMGLSYFRGSKGILIVFSITNRQSFDTARNNILKAQQFAEDGTVVMLVGDRPDFEGERAVTSQEACGLSKQHNIFYTETNSYTGDGIELLFKSLAMKMLNINDRKPNPIHITPDSLDNGRSKISEFFSRIFKRRPRT